MILYIPCKYCGKEVIPLDDVFSNKSDFKCSNCGGQHVNRIDDMDRRIKELEDKVNMMMMMMMIRIQELEKKLGITRKN